MDRSLKRIDALIREEMTRLLRDWRTLIIMLCTPLLALLLLGYAMHLNVERIPTAVADLSLDARSQRLVEAFAVSGSFDITMHVESEDAVLQAIDEGRVLAGLVIPPGLATNVQRGQAQVLVIFDGSDTLTVQSGYNAAVSIAQAQSMRLLVEKMDRFGLRGARLPIASSVRVLYNPDMKDLVFLIPGMAAMLLQFMSLNLTAMSVVRERESGTIEQILATPVRPIEFIIGKLVPNILLTVTSLATVILAGVFWFGVPFRGNVWLFAWLSLLFIISGLGLGLVVSTIAQTQRQAQQITTLLLMLSILITGFIYPRSAMPAPVQFIGGLIPLTYFIRIARGIFSKGIGLAFLWSDVLALATYVVVAMGLAAATFKKRLD
ncbi:MAG TPA: ABC transporter permease [Anaerolineae bacterium]|nr:ABC transporter permease [Anaerolineae bacterium]HOR01238.1 ABC transporter permease [Anaerolineae bacterium]HOR01241.1 ABC transporter permease [Anaerolineae bacterium]HPL27141.1 ABC transporter permease [Anaerolineae bacterium]